jgi:hypothetical protein
MWNAGGQVDYLDQIDNQGLATILYGALESVTTTLDPEGI